MKIAKLVLGIIFIAYSVFMFIQTGVYDVVDYIGKGLYGAFSSGDVSIKTSILVKSGYLVSCLMLAGGITSIAARKSYGGALACTILFALAAVVSYSGIVGYLLEYRIIPSIFCVAASIFYGVSLFAQNYNNSNNENEPEQVL